MSLGSIRELSAGPEPGGVSTFTNRRGGKDRNPVEGRGRGGEDGEIKKGTLHAFTTSARGQHSLRATCSEWKGTIKEPGLIDY